MATRLPSTGGQPGGAPVICDISDMLMFHRNLRKLYRDAAPMVRSVIPADLVHAKAVADHLDEIIFTLHSHHHGEDILLWDRLTARAPSCAVHVEQMKVQHVAMSALLDALGKLVTEWRTSPDASSTERLAAAVQQVNDTLVDHLGQEEEEIVPVAAVSMPQAEWDEMEEHGKAAIPKKRLLVNMGYILDSMTPDEGAAWAREHVPAPARLLYRLIGKRQFESEQRSLHPAG